jgi:flagellin-like hook-associated protein FlgL
VGPDLGFNVVDVTYAPSTSDSEVRPITITADTNDLIDFIEFIGGVPRPELHAVIPDRDYAEDDLAAAIETAMEEASELASPGGGIDYDVSYDNATNMFTIAGTGLTQLQLLWDTGVNSPGGTGWSAATVLGFSNIANDTGNTTYTGDTAVESITIGVGTNDAIDFKELPDEGTLSGELNVTITPGDYSTVDLASEIEAQMTAESAASGNNIVYDVSYDSITGKFTIKENGTTLDELQILWGTGTNSGTSVATTLGYDTQDDIVTPTTSDSEVEWGIFKTLIDLRDYLKTNDVSGISRSISRLDYHFENISTKISDIGSKIIRMEIKINIFQDLNIAHTDRLSNIEDADIVEAIMDLKEKELAYEAALASSARVMELSLIDYL